MGKLQEIIDILNFIIKEDGRRNSNFHRLESKVNELDRKLKLILKKIE